MNKKVLSVLTVFCILGCLIPNEAQARVPKHRHKHNDDLRLATRIVNITTKSVRALTTPIVVTPVPVVVSPPTPVVVTPRPIIVAPPPVVIVHPPHRHHRSILPPVRKHRGKSILPPPYRERGR